MMKLVRVVGLALVGLFAFAPGAEAQPQGGGPGGGPGGRRGPPAEAFTACDGLAVGAPCTVTFGQHRIQGTCAHFMDQRILCRPEGMPPRRPGSEGPPGPPQG